MNTDARRNDGSQWDNPVTDGPEADVEGHLSRWGSQLDQAARDGRGRTEPREDTMVRRLVVVGGLALALAGAGIGASGPASAQAEGCQGFGQFVVAEAQLEGPFGQQFDFQPAFGSPGFALQQARAHNCS